MNVLIITPRFNENSGGDGVYAYNLAYGLLKNDIDVSIFSIYEKHFVLHKLSKDLQNETYYSFKKVPSNFISKNYFSIAAYLSFKKALNFVKPDIIHIHGIHQYFTLSVASIIRGKNFPTVFTLHDYKILCGNAGFFSNRSNEICTKCLTGKVYPQIFENCKNNSRTQSLASFIQMFLWKVSGFQKSIDIYHAGSFYVKNLVEANQNIKGKVEVIRMPYNSNFIFNIPEVNKTLNEKLKHKIVFIGRLVPHKGIVLFCESVKNLDCEIHIFGDGPLMDYAKLMLTNNKALFHGWKNQQEIFSIIGERAIVVVPYLAPETFCFVVLEAMLNGCGVIASDIGAISELIENDYNGLLIKELSESQIEEKIKYLINNPLELNRIAANAKKINQTLDSYKEHSEKIKIMYENLIKLDQL